MEIRNEKGNGLLILKIQVMMYIITMLFLLVLAAVMLKLSPGAKFISIGLILAYIFSTFAGGFIMGKKKKKQKYLWGLAMGLIYFAVLFVVSVLLQKGMDLQQTKLISTFFICAIGGMFGGMLS